MRICTHKTQTKRNVTLRFLSCIDHDGFCKLRDFTCHERLMELDHFSSEGKGLSSEQTISSLNSGDVEKILPFERESRSWDHQ